ncbi:uncharacterized protein LOC115209345 isoform X1 [Argonauta hians]
MTKSTLFWYLITRIALCLATDFSVLSFEYFQRFQTPVDLGQCSLRYITIRGKYRVLHKDCGFYDMGERKFKESFSNDSFIVNLNEENLLTHIALCDGHVASYMGLLYEQDCLAVEIANLITFNQTTYVRAFVENYATGVDELSLDWRPFEGYSYYFKDDYYLKTRTYGTYEIIIVQLTFDNKNQRNAAQNLVLIPQLLSDQIEVIYETFGSPMHIRLIRVSTAKYVKETKDYPAKDFDKALYQIRNYENEVRQARKLVNEATSSSDLYYGFYPFANVPSEKGLNPRIQRLWENITQMEIRTGKTITKVQHATGRCKKRRKKPKFCHKIEKIEKIVKGLKKLQRQLHSVRSKWYYLSSDRQVNVTNSRSLRYDNLMKAVDTVLHTCGNSNSRKNRRKNRRKSMSSENHK